MTRSTNAAWDPTLRSHFGNFIRVDATGHGWQPRPKRFTRLLERAIAERRRERMQQEKDRRAAWAKLRAAIASQKAA